MGQSHSRPLWIVGGLAALGFIAGIVADAYWLRMLCKPLPVLMMIVACGAKTPYNRQLRRGLVACVIGDVLLEVSPSTFTAGLVAFLIGHVFYIFAYLKRTRRPAPLWGLGFAGYGLSMVMFLRPGLGAMLVPVTLYTVAICVMLWRAGALLGRPPTALGRFAFLGAVAFAASDSLIALNKFHEPIALVRYPIIVLYWLGQLGITASRDR